MGIVYFTYARAMDADVLEDCCPETRFLRDARFLGVGRLPGYRFIINTRGNATLVEDNTAEVQGVLWNIESPEIDELDAIEGAAPGHYQKRMLNVEAPDRVCYLALVFVDDEVAPGEPPPGYLETILKGAEKNNLPRNYREEIQSWRSVARV